MSHWLFPLFLTDSEAYAAAERYWGERWEEILRSVHPEQTWHSPWLSNPIPDGNPIFTAVCPELQRGVRVIQETPGDTETVDLDWWLDVFGDKDEPTAVRELVVACCPSRENEGLILHLLRQWIRDGQITEDPAENGTPKTQTSARSSSR
jgi:hypothetical protein